MFNICSLFCPLYSLRINFQSARNNNTNDVQQTLYQQYREIQSCVCSQWSLYLWKWRQDLPLEMVVQEIEGRGAAFMQRSCCRRKRELCDAEEAQGRLHQPGHWSASWLHGLLPFSSCPHPAIKLPHWSWNMEICLIYKYFWEKNIIKGVMCQSI